MKKKLSLVSVCLLLCLLAGCAVPAGTDPEPAIPESAATNPFRESESRDAGEPAGTEPPAAPDDRGEVAFSGELFGEDPERNFYNYAPTSMLAENGSMHIWYCGNQTDADVTDFIFYRKGTLHADGKWTFSEKRVALSPEGGSAWDGRHVCDPSVVKGSFAYGGESYSYLMAYLGCKTDDSTANEVGLAFAKAPEGPWVRYRSNPIANFYASGEYEASMWGYGQPSLVSVNRAGKVLLFYTKGVRSGTFTHVERWDFSNADSPKKEQERDLPNQSSFVALNNADFAYDPYSGNFCCVKEDHTAGEWYPTDGGVTWIGGSVSLLKIGGSSKNAETGLFSAVSYTSAATVGPAETGFPRNHNACLLTDEYGWIAESGRYPVIYTSARLASDFPDWPAGGQWPALHTYRLHGWS